MQRFVIDENLKPKQSMALDYTQIKEVTLKRRIINIPAQQQAELAAAPSIDGKLPAAQCHLVECFEAVQLHHSEFCQSYSDH
jgi:hypothetical protein